jgi:hypothetical protein
VQVQAYREYKEDCIGPALTSVMENSIKVHTTTQPHEVYVACACMHCIYTRNDMQAQKVQEDRSREGFYSNISSEELTASG